MTTLFDRISKVKSTNYYFKKDLKKASLANKFIGRGSLFSSTNKYMEAAGDLANCGEYLSSDIIFVSAEGDRRLRVSIDLEELQKAVDANVTFITDDKENRDRDYNVGEREVASFLRKKGYKDIGNGCWKKD